MREEPEEMLPEQNAAAAADVEYLFIYDKTRGKEKASACKSVHKLKHRRSLQGRECE